MAEKIRTFANSPIKLALPEMDVKADKIILHISSVFKNELLIASCKLISRTGGSAYVKDLPKRFKDTYFELEKNGNSIQDSTLILEFLAQDKRVTVSYTCNKDFKIELDNVETVPMSEAERMIAQNTKVETVNKAGVAQKEFVPLTNKSVSQVIEKYKKAVLQEKSFINTEGKKTYTVINGEELSGSNPIYSFEQDEEILIPDDSPIKLNIGGTEYNGEILSRDGNKIMLVLDKRISGKLEAGFIASDAGLLLDAINNRLRRINDNTEIANMLISKGPSLADSKKHAIFKGQKTAFQHSFDEPVTVIWGSPGTGKTYTIASIAINYLHKGKRVLIVSHSNISVDGVAQKVFDRISTSRKIPEVKQMLVDGKILRYGNIRDEKLNNNPYVSSKMYIMQKNKEIRKMYMELSKYKTLVENSKNTPEYDELLKEFRDKRKRLRAKEKECETEYVKNASFLATTISKVCIDKIFDAAEYDLVMFDEVSMAYIPHIFVAASYAKESFVCVGDFRQLAPIVQNKNAEDLSKDIFEYLNIHEGSGVNYHPWLVMLDEQRRMHPQIANFSSKNVYYGLLKNHEETKTSRLDISGKEPFVDSAVAIVDLMGLYSAAYKNKDNSHFNILSAVLAYATAEKSLSSGENDIGIITPYAAQARLIKAMLKDEEKEVSCATVHQFQGSERNVIIFDAVDNFPFKKVGLLLSQREGGAVSRLINVALTRTKGKFIAIANKAFWNSKTESNHILFKLIDYIFKTGASISGKTALKEYIDSLHTGKNIVVYTDIENGIRELVADIEKAKEQICITIPDGILTEGSETIYKCLKEVKERNIKVLIKCADYSNLPKDWKRYSYRSDDAVFPLINIDGKIIWYGLPPSRLVFKDENIGYVTTVPIAIRFSGSQTIKTITKSLVNFESVIRGEVISPLEEKNSDADDDIEADTGTGLAKYIEENVKCGLCGCKMLLSKGYKNKKDYLQCSNKKCGGTNYVDVNMVTDYLKKYDVCCPKHSYPINAKLGQYGVYLQSDCGCRFKLNEI